MRFAKVGPIIAITLFLTLTAHAAWDYAESRRLATSLSAIKAKEKPVSFQVISAGLQGEQANADRYFRAAAALASASGQWYPRSSGALADAMRSDQLTTELLAEMRRNVTEEPHATALRFLDQATALPFEGLVPRSSGGGQVLSDLMQLKELSDERTTMLSIDGQADAAASSLVGSFRLLQVLTSAGVGLGWRFTVDTLGRTAFVLEHTQPTSDALKRLASAISSAESHADGSLARYYETRRAQIIPRLGPATRTGLTAWSPLRPLETRSLRTRIDGLTATIEAMALPWPDRLDAVVKLSGVAALATNGTVAQGGGALAVTRSAGTAVAIEEYRRDHGGALPDRLAELVPSYLPNLPLDPFSGNALRYTSGPSRYSVYSVWLDRKDNQDVTTPRDYAQPGNSYFESAQDFGVVIPVVPPR